MRRPRPGTPRSIHVQLENTEDINTGDIVIRSILSQQIFAPSTARLTKCTKRRAEKAGALSHVSGLTSPMGIRAASLWRSADKRNENIPSAVANESTIAVDSNPGSSKIFTAEIKKFFVRLLEQVEEEHYE